MGIVTLPLWQILLMMMGLALLLLGALMLGWRLGRESQGKALFQATARLKADPRTTYPAEDPWALAHEPQEQAK